MSDPQWRARRLILVCGMTLILLGAESDRTTELVRRDCRTEIGRQEVTLFANGTLRLRDRLNDDRRMQLAELTPDEVEAYLRRLEGEDLSEVRSGRSEIQGDWVESCTLDLKLSEAEPRSFTYGRFDSLPLALARVNLVVDDMVGDTVLGAGHDVADVPYVDHLEVTLRQPLAERAKKLLVYGQLRRVIPPYGRDTENHVPVRGEHARKRALRMIHGEDPEVALLPLQERNNAVRLFEPVPDGTVLDDPKLFVLPELLRVEYVAVDQMKIHQGQYEQ